MATIYETPIITSKDNSYLSEEAIQNLISMGIEWKGRRIQEVYDEFSLKAMTKAVAIYQRHLQGHSLRSEESNTAIIDMMQKIFDQNGIPPFPEPNPFLRSKDPISGCYIVVPGTDCRLGKKIHERNQAIAKKLDEILQSKGFKTLILEN